MAELLTLYKLIILYMLDRVDFPLSNSQISDFIIFSALFTLKVTLGGQRDLTAFNLEAAPSSCSVIMPSRVYFSRGHWPSDMKKLAWEACSSKNNKWFWKLQVSYDFTGGTIFGTIALSIIFD